jgi:hypothetical protein
MTTGMAPLIQRAFELAQVVAFMQGEELVMGVLLAPPVLESSHMGEVTVSSTPKATQA